MDVMIDALPYVDKEIEQLPGTLEFYTICVCIRLTPAPYPNRLEGSGTEGDPKRDEEYTKSWAG